jgi:hypothetical protein
MSNPPCKLARMNVKEKIKTYSRVRLEPELEEIAGLWPANKRLEVARKFKRWAHQLQVSGRIMLRDAASCQRPRRPSLPSLAPRKAALN